MMDMTSLAADMADVDRMFGKTTDNATGTPVVEPSYRLQYGNNGAVLEVELPGVDKADIEIEVKERVLNIVGKRYYEESLVRGEHVANTKETKKEDEVIEKKLRLQYRLRLHLGADSDGNKMACKSYKDGLLILTLPSHKKDPVHKITVE